MTNKTMPSIIKIEEEKLKELVTEVKETIASDLNVTLNNGKQNKFGVTDMWKLHRKARTASSNRGYFIK